MRSMLISIGAKMLAVAVLGGLSASAFGAGGGDKAKVEGMIVTRTSDTLIVKSGSQKAAVVLTDQTVTKDDRGLFGLEKEQMSSTVLIPGLKIKVDGTRSNNGQVIAKTITVDGDDLETAEMIQAGLHPTAQQVEANMRAIETNQQNIAAHKGRLATHEGQLADQKGQLATQKESIEANQKNIGAHQQHI